MSCSYARNVPGARRVASCAALLLALVCVAPSDTQAQDLCYAAADGGNLLTQVNRNTGAETLIGGFGVSDIEAIAYYAVNGKLYGANAGQFGEINTSTGAFSAIGSGFGTGTGALGSVSFSDVDGLHFDPVPGGLYGVHRRGNGNDGNNDVLFRINISTGAYVPGVFADFNGDTQPDDYLVIYAGEAVDRWDIDDLAIDPGDGTMYGAANNGGSNDELIEINRVDGSVTLVGNMGVFDIEGLGFDSNGELFGTSGTAGTPANSIFDINKTTGAASLIANLTEGTDYEGVACLTDGTNLITGTVFYDDDEDGNLDPGESGPSGITVRLFRDDNGDGDVDPGEPQIGTQSTNGVGYYEFEVSSAGDFVIMVLQGDLPAGSTFTTDDVETASFPLGTFGATDPNNDFGYTTPPPPPGSLSISKTSNGTGPLPVGFTLTYTITVTNTGGISQTGIAVRDTLPPDVTYVPGSTQVTTPGSNDTFRDEFDNQNYTSNNGSVNWSGGWSEIGDNDNALTGNVRVEQDGFNPPYGVIIDKKNKGLERTADLSSYDSASLTFMYRSDDAGDEIEVLVNGDLLTTLTGGQSNYVSSGTINIDSYTGGNATVRLIGKKVGGPKRVWIDDVEVAASNSGGSTNPGNPPPLLTSGQLLGPGEQMTVTLQATVNSSPSSCALFNTAWVSSNESSSQSASKVDLIDEGTGCSLPVELTSFEVQLDGRQALLTWQTASETNNAGFEIQARSGEPALENEVWQALAFVNGHGTTETAQSYQYRVEDLEPGRYTFRLKQIDYDGTFEYHPEVEVFVEMAERFVVEPAYPNPFNPQAQMRFAVNRGQAVQVVLYDVLGRQMAVLYEGVAAAGQMQVVMIDGSGLPSGLYLVRVAGEHFVKTQTVTLLK